MVDIDLTDVFAAKDEFRRRVSKLPLRSLAIYWKKNLIQDIVKFRDRGVEITKLQDLIEKMAQIEDPRLIETFFNEIVKIQQCGVPIYRALEHALNNPAARISMFLEVLKPLHKAGVRIEKFVGELAKGKGLNSIQLAGLNSLKNLHGYGR